LSFRAGDVFEVLTETNPDWWTGRHNGKQGLFPSNYIEKLDSSSSPLQLDEKPPMQEQNFSSNPYTPQYQAPMGAPVPYQMPSPPNQQVVYNPYISQPPGGVVAQPAPPSDQLDKPPKKSRFGGMGNTVRCFSCLDSLLLLNYI